MFIFLLQVRHMLADQDEYYLFAFFSALVWALWLTKVVLSRRYRPWTEPHSTTTSVVVPVVDEPEDLFRDVLGRICEQRPDEVIVVINGARNPTLEQVSEEFAPLVRWVHTTVPGKRNAVRIGTLLSAGEITVLVDSDTVWTPGTLTELVKPFADARVGGVTTRQRILEPSRSWITRWADWLENTRSLYSMPAQSTLGQVGCLPGRTIAFRRELLVRVMDRFMTDKFLGVFLEISDDRTLTNLVLKEGFRTVYQHTSLVYTDAPLKVRKLTKQQLRWARGSQYNTLRMLPWMVGHAPVLAVFFVADILLPFLLLGTIGGWVYRAVSHTGVNFYQAMLATYGQEVGWAAVITLMILSSVLSMAIRQIRHLQEVPTDFLRLPVFIIVSTFFLMPIRLFGFFRMGHVAGWGTRAGAYAGRESLTDPGALRVSGGAEDWLAELDDQRGTAPLDVVDRGTVALAEPQGATRTATRTTLRAAAATAPAPTRRGPNPLAAIPYLIGAVLIGLEVLLYV
ncbi:glycosyltransferase [Actinotalea sp. M2MS4P-6]|uniref:glycosyltransferase n=1 Tax=Actinotalea sp. M2MS4P-6 TaxID=2983762 RepID=UPI0021E4992E|nr:glycosyltransferase [Actinotalea sp. M2MS4P-6]MCV2396024.1 glycosyltransferase [Actinotalea sp. M2MS4P-6]